MQVAEILTQLLLKALGTSAHQPLRIVQGQICIDGLCYCLEGESVVECTAVAKALCTLDASTERWLRRKFDLLKENMPFTKWKSFVS